MLLTFKRDLHDELRLTTSRPSSVRLSFRDVGGLKLAFHDADTDTDTDILAGFSQDCRRVGRVGDDYCEEVGVGVVECELY